MHSLSLSSVKLSNSASALSGRYGRKPVMARAEYGCVGLQCQRKKIVFLQVFVIIEKKVGSKQSRSAVFGMFATFFSSFALRTGWFWRPSGSPGSSI